MSRVAPQHPRKLWPGVVRTLPLAAFLAVASCSEDAKSPTMPVPSNAPAEIIDGARQGNPHFFFLPPLVPQPLVTGVVDPNVGPNVVICEWDTSVPGGQCGALIAQFSREVNTVDAALIDAPGQVRFNGNHYYAFWNTQECITGPCQLDPSKNYRIRVLVGLTELGHADVNVVQGQNALKNIDTNEYIGLVDGKKLPLKFRIEVGAVDVVAPGEPAMIGSAGGEVSTTDGEVSLKIPSNALAAETPITVEKVTEERPQTGEWSDVVELGPDGTTFTYPVTLTLSYDVTKLPPGVPPEALKVSTWVNDHWEEVPGSTLNLSNATISAPITHFSSYSLAIWPNAVQGAPGPQQLYVGQSTTLGSMSWYYQTVPYQQCYTNAIWVSRWYGGYWRYQTHCYTYTQTYGYPMSGYVGWSSQNAAILSVGAPGYSIANGNGQSISPLISAVGPGTANITARFGNVSSSVSYSAFQQLVFDVFGTGTVSTRKFGFRQGTGLNVRIPTPRATDLTVSFTHSNSAVLTTNPSLVIPAGATQHGLTMIAGTTAGFDTLAGNAAGYGPDSLFIETGPGRVYVENWPASLNYGDSAAIRIRPMAPDSSIIDNAWQTTFQLASDGKLAFSRANAAIASITVPDGTSSTPVFYVKAIGSGAASMTVTNAWYVTGPYAVTIAPPPVVSVNVQPNPAGVKPGQTVQLTATALDGASQPVAGVSFTWQSSNTAIATVDANGLVSGLTNGNVTVTATGAGVSGSTTVKVGTPSISPSPGSVTIQVNQGQSKSAQITINNGGGGVLSGLQAGPFSNYFNGSPAPWVTATFNTTTAPAIMTITAAPGLEIPAGVHQLRFDVFAPGVNAYTFYSINVTVVDKDIVLVNATIAPSPGSVGISVPAGSTRTAQITINNSGTDPLTQLTAGPFSNYFNGSPAPWVNASFNTTTAPAVLTITASPPLNTPQGLHALRFDVMSPGATNSPYTFYNIPVTVTAPEIPPFLAGGGKSTCALKADQTVLCWGEASNGATTPSSGTFTTIGGGFFHYCGIRPDRSLNCWGYNSDLRATPPTTGTFNRISVGPEHNCALRTDDTAICWGFGGDGRSSPLPGTYKMIGVGWYHSCAVRTDDTVACWGQNGAGQSTAPAGTFKVVGGGPSFSCGIRTDDTLECWGIGIPAPPGGTFKQLATATAGGHACAIRSDDTLVCWGQNDHGQANAPSGQFIQVVTNYLQSCAVRASRAVVCWGSGATGATSVPSLLANP